MTAAVVPNHKTPYGARQLKSYIEFSTYRAFILTNLFIAAIFLFAWILLNQKNSSAPFRALPNIIEVTDYTKYFQRTKPLIPATTSGSIGKGISNNTGGNPVPVPNIEAPKIEFTPNAEYNPLAHLGTSEGTKTTLTESTTEENFPPAAKDTPGKWDFQPVEEEPAVDFAELRKFLVYPEIAKRAGVEGKVILRVLVSPSGKAEQTEIETSPHPQLSEAAIVAVRKANFTPAIQNGEKVYCWISIPVEFRLR